MFFMFTARCYAERGYATVYIVSLPVPVSDCDVQV